MKAAGNRTCIITWRLSDFKSQANIPSVKSFIFLLPVRANPSRSFVPIVLEIHTKEKIMKLHHILFLSLRRKAMTSLALMYFFSNIMRFPRQKRLIQILIYYSRHWPIPARILIRANAIFLSPKLPKRPKFSETAHAFFVIVRSPKKETVYRWCQQNTCTAVECV